MRHEESRLQIACFKYFRLQYPQYRMLYFAVPNGGHRNIITAKIQKAEGCLAGAADSFLAVPRKDKNGLFIEFKSGKNKQTESQVEFMQAVVKMWYAYQLVYSFDD